MGLIVIHENKELVNYSIDKYELKYLKKDIKGVLVSIRIYFETLNRLLSEVNSKREVTFLYQRTKPFLIQLKKNIKVLLKEYSNEVLTVYAFTICRLRDILSNKDKHMNTIKKIKQIILLMK
jgi:hypothetical protein